MLKQDIKGAFIITLFFFIYLNVLADMASISNEFMHVNLLNMKKC